jgi:hypothetical protein
MPGVLLGPPFKGSDGMDKKNKLPFLSSYLQISDNDAFLPASDMNALNAVPCLLESGSFPSGECPRRSCRP